jgi:hypothetical protein
MVEHCKRGTLFLLEAASCCCFGTEVGLIKPRNLLQGLPPASLTSSIHVPSCDTLSIGRLRREHGTMRCSPGRLAQTPTYGERPSGAVMRSLEMTFMYTGSAAVFRVASGCGHASDWRRSRTALKDFRPQLMSLARWRGDFRGHGSA